MTALPRLAIAVVLLLAAAAPAGAQLSVTVRDISPDRSTHDPWIRTARPAAASSRSAPIARRRVASGRRANGAGCGGATTTARTGPHIPSHVPMATWDVEVDPTNSNRVYATSFYDGRVNSRAGINVSTDGGTTWTHPATATPPANFCIDEPGARSRRRSASPIDPATPPRVRRHQLRCRTEHRFAAPPGRSSIRRRPTAPTMSGTSSSTAAAPSTSAAQTGTGAPPTAARRGRPPPRSRSRAAAARWPSRPTSPTCSSPWSTRRSSRATTAARPGP